MLYIYCLCFQLALLAVAATVIVVLAIMTGGSDEIPGSDEPAVTTDHLFHRHNLHAPYADSAHCMVIHSYAYILSETNGLLFPLGIMLAFLLFFSKCHF